MPRVKALSVMPKDIWWAHNIHFER